MPLKPMRPCRQPGCPHLTQDKSGYCPACLTKSRQQIDKERPSASQRGYNYQWQQASKAFLREHPLCRYCYEKEPQVIRAAVLVDHHIPHKGNMTLFWNETNWWSSCAACHRIKSAQEDGAFGNPIRQG